jgi:hypothetical protein
VEVVPAEIVGQVVLTIVEEAQVVLQDHQDIRVAVAHDLREALQEVHTQEVVAPDHLGLHLRVPAQEALRQEVPEDAKLERVLLININALS